jgi:hypothetical protein
MNLVFEDRHLVRKPGIYCNKHYPHMMIKVSSRCNKDIAGYVSPGAWGVSSEYWRKATLAETIHYHQTSLYFVKRRIAYRMTSMLYKLGIGRT